MGRADDLPESRICKKENGLYGTVGSGLYTCNNWCLYLCVASESELAG